MKTIFRSILIGLLIGTQAYAGLPPTTIKGQSDASPKTKFSFQVPNSQATDLGGIKALIETGNQNMLANPTFQASSITSGWTVNAGTPSTDTSVYYQPLGKQSLKLTLSAVNGDILTQTLTPGSPLTSVALAGGFLINTTLTTLQACTLSAGVEQQCLPITATGTWQTVTPTMLGASSGSVGVKIKSTSSTTGTLNVAYGYFGPNAGISTTTVSTNWQSYTPTFTGFGTVTTQNMQWMQDGPNIKIRGTFTIGTPTATEARVSLPNTFTALSTLPTLSNAGEWFRDQSTTNKGGPILIEPNASYITFSDTSTFGASATVALAKAQGATIASAGNTISLTAEFPIQGFTANASGYKPDQTPASWSGFTTASSSFTQTSSGTPYAYGDFTGGGASVALSTRTNVNITCVNGSTTTPSITCTLPRSGRYELTYKTTLADNTTSATVGTRLVDGSGTVIAVDPSTFDSSGTFVAQGTTGQYIAAAAGSVTFKIQAMSNTASHSLSLGNASVDLVDWTIKELDAPMSAPYLTGSVTSNTSGMERVERVKVGSVCSSTPCTITSQSGSWVSSITRNSVGNYTITFAANAFSAAPSCFLYAGNTGGTLYFNFGTNIASTNTSWTFSTTNPANSGTDSAFDIMCMGPR